MSQLTKSLSSARLFLSLIALTSVLIASSGCGDPFARGEAVEAVSGGGGGGTGDSGGGGGADGGTTEVSFAKQVYPALQSGCGCHAGSGIGDFGLGGNASEGYAKIKALVNVDAPADSKLVKKGKGESHGGGAMLSEANAATVLNWITQGAANN